MIEICDHVRQGHFDSIITNLDQAVRERRDVLKLADIGFSIGDRARFTMDVNPQYLRKGVEVVGVKDSGEIIVKSPLPGRTRRFRVRANQLEKVS